MTLDELDAMHAKGVALTKRGIVEGMRGDLDAAERAYAAAHALNEAIVEQDPERISSLVLISAM